MLMQGGGRHELFMPLQPEQADPGFSCYHCNKWQLAQPCSGRSASRESTEMPSREGKPPCPRCAQSSRVDFQVKPYAKWTREAQSFVTRMFLTINYSSWKKTGCFGGTQKQWSTDGQRTCTGLRRERAVESKSSSTKESLSSQNTTISPIVISQMIDENKSKENWPVLSMLSMISQPSAYQVKQSLVNHGAVSINRAFMVLPSRIEIQASLDDTTSPSDSPTAEEKQCQNQHRGFASITITARRVAVGFSDPAHGSGAVQEPNAMSHTSSKVPVRSLHCWPPHGHTNQHVSPLKVSESCSQFSEEPRKQLFDPGNKENSVGLQSSDGRENVPPSFISCVHLQVSQRCPNTIYYLDKSLNVCIDQPQIKCQKIHRSALSFNINCSLSRLTADGVDGIANGEPIEEIFQTKLLEENKIPLRSNSSADLTENNVINKEKTNGRYLGSKYPLQSVFFSELPAFVDTPRGPNNIVTAKKDDGTQMLSGSKKNQCTTGWSSAMDSGSLPDTASRKAVAVASDVSLGKRDPSKGTSRSKEIQAQGILKPKISVSRSLCNLTASSRTLLEENVHRENQLLKSDYEFCGSSDKLKEREEEDEREGASRVTLSTAHSPDVTHGKSNALTQPETSSQAEKHPPTPRTLREALEIHKPQFICRSQERLKRLEQMVQLRKAQQSEAPATNQVPPLRKSASTSTSSRRKQFTVPHPLSGKLDRDQQQVCSCLSNLDPFIVF
uniref:Chromosome 10 open reading frame 90 n=1 Tax=Strigops habroptila TaxID=2489341 RepID=A0A672TUX0_STRHB